MDYTKLFEKNRTEVESDINKAQNKEDASQLKSKLEENNQQLKDTAKKYLNSSNNDSDSAKEAIKNHISPLIDKQITDINKTNISDNHVDNARKMQLRCIIVCKIIMIRVDTIKTSEKISSN